MFKVDMFAEPRRADPGGWWTNRVRISVDENRRVSIRLNGDLLARDLAGLGLDAVLEDVVARTGGILQAFLDGRSGTGTAVGPRRGGGGSRRTWGP